MIGGRVGLQSLVQTCGARRIFLRGLRPNPDFMDAGKKTGTWPDLVQSTAEAEAFDALQDTRDATMRRCGELCGRK